VLSLARLVEKKGLDRQLRIYAALRAAGVEFTARIVGTARCGRAREPGGEPRVADLVTFVDRCLPRGVGAPGVGDVLLHTGVVARAATATPSQRDREAMAAGFRGDLPNRRHDRGGE